MVQGEDEEVERKQHQEVFVRFLWETHQGDKANSIQQTEAMKS